jgi:hypothetical protein
MQPISLQPEVLAHVSRELAVRAQTAGTEILGSQLGKLINDALAPHSLREFGGLRTFVESHLGSVLRQREFDATSPDVAYDIVDTPPPAARPLSVPKAFQAVAGADLWRFYSNPNLKCQLAAMPSGAIVVGPEGLPMPEPAVSLARFGTEQYRQVAETFQRDHSGNARVAEALSSVLQEKDFYGDWIVTLRNLRAEPGDLLRKWEILREATISQQLTHELSRAGIDATRVAEIVQLARPVAKSAAKTAAADSGYTIATPPHARAVKAGLAAQTSRFAGGGRSTDATGQTRIFVSTTTAPKFAGGGLPVSLDEAEELRQLVHRAVEVMSLAELREVRLSANTLMKLTAKISA